MLLFERASSGRGCGECLYLEHIFLMFMCLRELSGLLIGTKNHKIVESNCNFCSSNRMHSFRNYCPVQVSLEAFDWKLTNFKGLNGS